MQLTDHDAFSTIDDESSLLSHQRDLTKIDFLFGEVENLFVSTFFVDIPYHEPDHDTNGGSVGHPPLSAFENVILWWLKVVLHEVELTCLVEVLDGENTFKDRLQADIFALVWELIGLQKLLV